MKKKSKRVWLFFMMVMLFLLFVCICNVWVNSKRTQTGYLLVKLKKEIMQLEEYNRRLTIEMAFLKSSEYLEKKAIAEFGLKYPSPEQVIFLQ